MPSTSGRCRCARCCFGGLLAAWATRRVLYRRPHVADVDGASLSVLLALAVMSVALLVSLALGHEAALQDGMTPAFLLLFFVFFDLCRQASGVKRLSRTCPVRRGAGARADCLERDRYLGLAGPHVLLRASDRWPCSPCTRRDSRASSWLAPSSSPSCIVLMSARWLAAAPAVLEALPTLAAIGLLSVALLLTFTRGFWLVASRHCSSCGAHLAARTVAVGGGWHGTAVADRASG